MIMRVSPSRFLIRFLRDRRSVDKWGRDIKGFYNNLSAGAEDGYSAFALGDVNTSTAFVFIKFRSLSKIANGQYWFYSLPIQSTVV